MFSYLTTHMSPGRDESHLQCYQPFSLIPAGIQAIPEFLLGSFSLCLSFRSGRGCVCVCVSRIVCEFVFCDSCRRETQF